MNTFVEYDDLNMPYIVLPGRPIQPVTNTLERFKLWWKCSGCAHGRQHFRRLTSNAVRDISSVRCLICLCCESSADAQGVAMPCSNEQKFMQIVWGLGLDGDYTHRVVAPFWTAPLDFYNHAQDFYIQIDGVSHRKGMHKTSAAKVQYRDFKQMRMMEHGRDTIVRVHDADLQNPSVVHEALIIAKAHGGIVLTPSYANCEVEIRGFKEKYVDALERVLPCDVMTRCYNNISLFQTM